MMIQWLEKIDQKILLFINGLNHPIVDEIAWFFSSKFGLIPFYLLILFFLFKDFSPKKVFILLLGVAVTLTLTDQISVHLFKEIFMRYRPSHHVELSKMLHFYEPISGQAYKGGQYGFISSHAANFFGMFGFLYVSFSKRNWLKISVFCLGLAVIWSRVYLGVHYPSDVVVGAFVGLAIGGVVWLVANQFILKKIQSRC